MKPSDIEGKTIRRAVKVKKPNYDDEGFLLLEFTDGTDCIIEAWFGSFSGNSEEEYPTGISVRKNKGGFVPVEEQA